MLLPETSFRSCNIGSRLVHWQWLAWSPQLRTTWGRLHRSNCSTLSSSVDSHSLDSNDIPKSHDENVSELQVQLTQKVMYLHTVLWKRQDLSWFPRRFHGGRLKPLLTGLSLQVKPLLSEFHIHHLLLVTSKFYLLKAVWVEGWWLYAGHTLAFAFVDGHRLFTSPSQSRRLVQILWEYLTYLF